MLKVAFDGQILLKGKKTGIAWCAESILLQLAEQKKIEKQFNCFTLLILQSQRLF